MIISSLSNGNNYSPLYVYRDQRADGLLDLAFCVLVPSLEYRSHVLLLAALHFQCLVCLLDSPTSGWRTTLKFHLGRPYNQFIRWGIFIAAEMLFRVAHRLCDTVAVYHWAAPIFFPSSTCVFHIGARPFRLFCSFVVWPYRAQFGTAVHVHGV